MLEIKVKGQSDLIDYKILKIILFLIRPFYSQ